MSETRDMMLASFDRVVADHLDRGAREAADLQTAKEAGAEPWPSEVWAALEQQGMTALGEIAEGDLGFVDSMALVRRSAYHAVPLPLAETFVARRLLARAGLELPDGVLTISAPASMHDVVSVREGQITGRIAHVPFARGVRHLVIPVGSGRGAALALVNIERAIAHASISKAGEPRDTVDLGRAMPVAVGTMHDAPLIVEAEGALMRAVQMSGALSRVLAEALTWVSDRVQFGKPIARFQAVQHLVAELASECAAASAASDMAVEASVSAPDRFSIAVAKARVGEAAGRASAIAHQLFGAMGFT
ncbi:MAG TPA: acyl-CoA dehydrogenase family protein, partial [Hyphomicrobiaceae bacterium]|nr:acyl-CoA dehydrogenase family protein [Hyphomicrobiaceae bacterium]